MAAPRGCLALALAVLLSAAPRAAAQAVGILGAIQDSRCYLMNGGAVESFFVSEDTPVGSIIGTLSVNGDPSDTDGNISLKLQEKNAAIGIVPGTKNITLLRPLDREEKQGPSNVYVNVRCDRRRTTDPSFIIPVSVRVWDVNDNAPVWLGAPYRVRLSELTAVGSRVLAAIRATDADQPGPHATIHYSVLPGPHSEYFGFANELDSVLVVKKPLDFEALNNFTVVLRASDQGVPPLHNDTTLRVEVLDADDQNPRFTHDHYSAIVPDDAQEGTILETRPGPVSAADRDVGINAPLHYSLTGERRDLVAVDRDTGRVAATRRLLEAGDLPVTVVVKATQVDNADRYALATLWLGRGAARAVRFARRAFWAAAREDAPPGAVLARLATEPRGAGPLQFYVSDRGFLDRFAINGAGEVLLRKPLDYETADSYHYQVMVTDGNTNDTASLNISVLNVNEWEPRFRYPQYEFRVEEAAAAEAEGGGLLRVGKLDVHDGDKPDTVSLTLRGSDAGMFYINDSGEMYMRQEALQTLNSSVLHVVATAVDSGAPPRQTSVPVLVHVSERLLSPTTSGSTRGALLAACAGALALLALLVVVLLAYIFRNKRRSKSPPTPSPPSKAAGFVPREPPRSPPASAAAAPGGLGASSGSLLSVSAGASTILANSSSSLDLRGDTLPGNGNGTRSATSGRQSQRFPAKTKVAPAPPAADAPPAAPPALALMSDHLRAGAASRSGVAWPSATIPARVKKLSWDDADHPHDDDAKGSPRPLDATNPALHDHLNLTVYF
ncbi:protocadherin-16 isoform X2 [Hyposmocoma kahamanoa]|uniref:protocadherin-16 isoform X2 n=1 Tax=Hyposmocoma kahamanoa TaxID=1477025 RepID=UPI000E6DA123|nr:protocadherin-16 isoform X2 [Hyposmocoma kahamanoa]